MKDMLGRDFEIGQHVAKAYYSGDLRISKVTKIVDNKVYLGKSKNPLYYLNRVLILDYFKELHT
jgi:hypothetical protein